MPRDGLMCLPRKVDEGCGSSNDFGLMRNPAVVRLRSEEETKGCKDCGDGPKKEMSSRYWTAWQFVCGGVSECGVRKRWTTLWAMAGACVQPKGSDNNV